MKTKMRSREEGDLMRDMPTELIHAVSQKVEDMGDYINFRAVCKRWRLSAPLSERPQQQQHRRLPWLLQFNGLPGNGACLTSKLPFYSIATGKTGFIPIPKSCQGKLYQGPGHTHLLLLHLANAHDPYQVLSLFNPFNHHEIPLPPLPPDINTNTHTHLIWPLIWPVFSSSGAPSNWHIVISPEIGRGRPRCCIYDPHTMEWKYVETYFRNTCYFQGMLLTTVVGRPTQVFDATSGKQLYQIPPLSRQEDFCVRSFLVESSGAVLRLSWSIKFRPCRLMGSSFDIYRLDLKLGSVGQQQPCWVTVSDIGDQIIFLDMMDGFSLTAPPGFKGNCIYFILPYNHYPSEIGRFDISTGIVERLHCPFEHCTWFLPNLG